MSISGALRQVVPLSVLTLILTSSPLGAEIIEMVLVKVNGEIVTLSDWEKRQFNALRGRQDLAKVEPGDPELSRAIAEITPSLILSTVDELLWLQRAREHGWALSKEQFANYVADLKKSQPDIADDAAFKRALEAEGMTEEDLFKEIERGTLIGAVQREDVANKISVTEEEVRTYYENNKREFTTPAEVTVREILIALPTSDKGINVAQDDDARAKAEDIRKRLLAGEPFPRLAGELSDSGSKANGGLIGPLKLGDLEGRLQKVLSPIQVGQVTEVVQTSRGYQIFRMETRSEEKTRELEDARADVSRTVAQGKSQAEMWKYLEKLRSQAKITWRNDELKRVYEQALSQRLAKTGIMTAPSPASRP
jgi:parvulin-like peptidyl-prolyl isomerase